MASSSHTGVLNDAGFLHGAILRNTSSTATENEGGLSSPRNDTTAPGAEARSCVPPRKRIRTRHSDEDTLSSPKRARVDSDNDTGNQSHGNNSHPPAASGLSGLSASTTEFTNLVEKAQKHPALPSILLKLFSAASNRDVSSTLPAETLRVIQEANTDLAKIADLAASCGVEAAVRSPICRPLDIFFAILSAATTNVNDNDNNTLRAVLSACDHACSISLNLWGGLSGPRTKLDARSRKVLDKWFEIHIEAPSGPYPDEDTKASLAKECGLTISQVATYFANRRMRTKRKLLKTAPNMDDGVIGTNAPALTKWRVALIAGSADNINAVRKPNNNNIASQSPTAIPTPIAPVQRMPYFNPSPPESHEAQPQYEYNQYDQYHHEYRAYHQYHRDLQIHQHSLDPLGDGLVYPSRPPLRIEREGSDSGYGSRCSTPPRSYLR